MKVYLAGRYERRLEIRKHLPWFDERGLEVTSRWLGDTPESEIYPQGYTPEVLNNHPDLCWTSAQMDLEDVLLSDWIISETYGGGGRGGRHVEFGMGLAMRKRLTIIGPREHVFHTLTRVEVFSNWDEFKEKVSW